MVADLAAVIAHEFNNVLMGIAPFGEIVGRRANGDQQLIKASAQIRSAIARGRRITQDLTRFSRPSEPRLVAVDVRDLVRSCVERLQPSLGSIPLEVTLTDEPLPVRADPQHIEQAITDLLLNAREALAGAAGGRVTLRAFAGADLVQVEIEDNGPGICSTNLERIFDPFYSTKRNGTGLGLTVAQQIARSHGGRIDVSSESSVRTLFSLVLPLDRTPDAHAALANDVEVLRGRSVLLVEDDDAVAAGLVLLLESCAAAITHATTAAEAVKFASERRFDCVLLDVGLPDGHGGKIFDQIRLLQPDVAVIFSTGSGDERVLQSQLRQHRVTHLQKPYDLDTLIRAVTRVFSE